MAFENREENKILLWMYPHEKKNDKQPDISGPGRVNKEVLKALVDAYKKYGDNGALKLRAAGWDRTGKNGEYTFITIEVQTPKPEEDASDDIPF